VRNKFRAELGARGISTFVSREGWLLKGLFEALRLKHEIENVRFAKMDGGARVRGVGQRANGRPNQFHTPTRRQSLFPIPLATRWFVNGRENARLLINETHYHQAFRDFHRVASLLRINEQNRSEWHSRTAVCVPKISSGPAAARPICISHVRGQPVKTAVPNACLLIEVGQLEGFM